MTKRIAIVGAGALGGYVGGTLAHLGHDVTLIDAWPEQIETIRARGLELDGMTPEERFTVKSAKTMHLTEVQSLARRPVDVAMVAVKSYDTPWASALIKPYLSAEGFVVSLQNCLNEETIAGVVGWGRTVGAVASMISVDLYEAGRIRRTVPKGGDDYTIFRIGEPHGRITPRARLRGRRRRARGGRGPHRAEGRRQPARRHPAPVDGAGHPQGPAHRDRRHERLHRAQGRRGRRAGAEPCQARRDRDARGARRARAVTFASGRSGRVTGSSRAAAMYLFLSAT